MTATSVTVIEQVDGSCELVINAFGQALVIRLDCDQAIHLGRVLLDGGQVPTVEATAC